MRITQVKGMPHVHTVDHFYAYMNYTVFLPFFFSFKLDFRASVCSTLSSFRMMILVNYKEKKYATHKLSYSRKTQPYQHGPKPSIAAITATGTCM